MASQNRLPTGDSGVDNAWSAINAGTRWSEVDDTIGSPDDDTTYIFSNGSNRNQLFTYTAFSLGSGGLTIQSVTVTVRGRRTSTSLNIGARIRVNGTTYEEASPPVAGSTYANRTVTWATNPDTGAAWTQADVEGIGSHPLQQFGVANTQTSGTEEARVTQVYVTVNYTPTLSAGAGSFLEAGQNANLLKDSRLLAGIGTFSAAEVSANFLRNLRLTASAGSFIEIGKTASLVCTLRLLAGIGALNLSGISASSLTARRLLAGAGTFTESGHDVTFLRTHILILSTGDMAMLGHDILLSRGFRLLGGMGTFGLTGLPASLLGGRRLSGGQGSFGVVGQNVNFARAYIAILSSTDFHLNSIVMELRRDYVLFAEGYTWTWGGVEAALRRTVRLVGSMGQMSLSGIAARLLPHRRLIALATPYALSGVDAIFGVHRRQPSPLAMVLVDSGQTYAVPNGDGRLSVAIELGHGHGSTVLSKEP